MTTSTTTSVTSRADRPGDGPAVSATGVRVTGRRVLAAEALKLSSLRSSRWLVAASVLSIVAAGIMPALGVLLAGLDPPGGAPRWRS